MAADVALHPAGGGRPRHRGFSAHCATRWGSFGHLSMNYFPIKMKITVHAKPLTCRWKWAFNYSLIQPLASGPCASHGGGAHHFLGCFIAHLSFDTALTIFTVHKCHLLYIESAFNLTLS